MIKRLKWLQSVRPTTFAIGASVCLASAIGIYGIASSIGRPWYVATYINPIKEDHVTSLLSAPIAERGIKDLNSQLSLFLAGGWGAYLTEVERKALLEKQSKVNSLLSSIQEREKAVALLRVKQQEQQKAIDEEKRVQFYTASMVNCFVDAPCDTFDDRIGRVEGGILQVGDFKCKLQGESGEGGYGACSVSMAGDRPISARQWDPSDGFVTTKVVLGKRTKVVDREKLENPYIAIQQRRINQMMDDFKAERINGDINCRNLSGNEKVECYGAQEP